MVELMVVMCYYSSSVRCRKTVVIESKVGDFIHCRYLFFFPSVLCKYRQVQSFDTVADIIVFMFAHVINVVNRCQ